MAGHFRSNVWDPVLILTQIITLQCFFYTCYGLWVQGMDAVAGMDISIGQILTNSDLTYLEDSGFINILAYALNSLTGALGLWIVVGRTRQCLDFSATCHLLHFFVCWSFNGRVPSTVSWYLINAASLTVMTILGEFLCMRSEMKAIPLLGSKVDL